MESLAGLAWNQWLVSHGIAGWFGMEYALWEQNLRAEACDVYAKAFKYAASLIPAGFKGEISWGHLDNRSFLRLAHGYLLALMHRGDGKAASKLAKQLLNWCPMDNLGVRFLTGDIALMNGDFKGALKEYLNGADSSPGSWYQAGLIAFRQEKYVDACTYLRKGIAANPYIAEGLTGRTILREHNYWHSSGVEGASWAVDYLESPCFEWRPDEIDFADWVFNASHVLQERADLTRLRESMSCEQDGSARVAIGREMMRFRNGIDSSISKEMVRQTRNRDGALIWPWIV